MHYKSRRGERLKGRLGEGLGLGRFNQKVAAQEAEGTWPGSSLSAHLPGISALAPQEEGALHTHPCGSDGASWWLRDRILAGQGQHNLK